MANILLYIQEDQIDPVMEEGDVGSGQKNFGGTVNDRDRVFIASKYEGDLSIVGEIPVLERYVDENHPHGWKYRVRSSEGEAVRYKRPVRLKEVRTKLSILRGKGNLWSQIRNARWLTDEDAELLSKLGRGK